MLNDVASLGGNGEESSGEQRVAHMGRLRRARGGRESRVGSERGGSGKGVRGRPLAGERRELEYTGT